MNIRSFSQLFKVVISPERTFIFTVPHFNTSSNFQLLSKVKISFAFPRFCTTMVNKKPFERLPKTVLPTNYALKLKPDLKKFTFAGEQTVALEIKETTNKLCMNAAELKVSAAKYVGNGQEYSKEIQIEYEEDEQRVVFTFPKPLKCGKGSLNMTFTGILNNKMKGFYRSSYKTPKGEERFAAVTQFEATDARRAFPCWDEPAVKATFDVTLVVPKDLVALSNMPEKTNVADTHDASHKVVTYHRTPIMSTYLLAFVVGEFDYVEDKDSDGVLIRVYTPVGKKEQGTFALEVAVKTLPFYKDYFNIAYPLPKLDLIAIADFAAGAMENWGLVTYRESALLVDAVNSSSSARQWVALVVGHEIAHQWFGNLVTMEWWTHLWLNEGFASWIEYLCVDHCFKHFDIWTQFASNDFSRALELDALKNSHPIEVPVGHPSEIDEIFDTISYSKGASIIRMLHNWIGDKSFRAGMHAYLDKHKYTNTFTEDLWAALGSASGQPVRKVMDTWTRQMGFPVLEVSQEVAGSTRKVTVKQHKFCADGSAGDASAQWLVPVSFCSQESPEVSILTELLTSREATYQLPPVTGWVKVNTGNVGFYRTHYSSDMLEALLPAISNCKMPPRDRLGLQNDLYALARAGVASTAEFLKLSQAFQSEDNYTVWSDLSSNMAEVGTLIQNYNDDTTTKQYHKFVHKLFGEIFQKLGWEPKEGESPLDAMLRGLVVARLGKSGEPVILAEAKKRFLGHAEGTSKIAADLRGPVFATVNTHGHHQEFEHLLKLYRAADMQEEKDRILRILGCSKQPEVIQKALAFAVSDEVRSQDTVFAIGSCASTKAGRELSWKFVKDNWGMLHERYKGGFLLSRLVKSTTDSFASEAVAKDIDEFFQKNPAPAAERTIKQSLENIRLNEQQLKRDIKDIKAFLNTC